MPPQLLEYKRSWAGGHSRLYVMQLFGSMVSANGEEPRVLQAVTQTLGVWEPKESSKLSEK